MRGPHSRTGTLLAAATVGSVAVGLRFWRLSWGLADGYRFPDEIVFAGRAAAFVPLSRDSFALHEFGYPALYGYLSGAAAALAWALGLLDRPPHVSSPTTVLVGRVVSAALGVATVGLVGVTATRMFSRPVGIVAAAFLAVAPLHAMHAHLALTEVALTAGAALALHAAHELAARPGPLRALAAGSAAGLTFATKYTGLALLAPLGWAAAEGGARTRSVGRAAVLGASALAGFAGAFALGCPPCVTGYRRVLATMHLQRVMARIGVGFPNNTLVPSLGWYGRPYVYQLVAALPFGLGWPLHALALAGVGVALCKRTVADRVLLTTLLPYFVVIAGYRVVFPRYLLPLFPGLVILAARAGCGLRRPWMRAMLLVGIFGYSLALASTQVGRFSLDQQREIARWIAMEVPPVEGRAPRVAVPALVRGLDYFGLARFLTRAGLAYVPMFDGRWLQQDPDVLVLPEWLKIAIRRDALPQRPMLDDLEAGALGYRLGARWPPSWYLQRDLYTRLDPAFAADLWQGEIGFEVWVRERPTP